MMQAKMFQDAVDLSPDCHGVALIDGLLRDQFDLERCVPPDGAQHREGALCPPLNEVAERRLGDLDDSCPPGEGHVDFPGRFLKGVKKSWAEASKGRGGRSSGSCG